MKPTSILNDLLGIGVFKVGEFLLKGNRPTPFYIDLRHIPSYPRILNGLVSGIHAEMQRLDLQFDVLCGVPYNALPFTVALCSRYEMPMLLKRKEAKSYGTKKMIEGIIVEGHKCLVIEDVVVSGTSILESVLELRKEGLIVTDCITVLDRLQGGKENLAKAGIRLHSLFNIHDIFDLYCQINNVEPSLVQKVHNYLEHNQCGIDDVMSGN